MWGEGSALLLYFNNWHFKTTKKIKKLHKNPEGLVTLAGLLHNFILI